MIYIVIAAFFAGTLVGTAAHFLSTNDTIDRIKRDAKASLQMQANDSFAAGYLRGYKDKTARRTNRTETDDMTLLLDLVS